MILFVRQEAKQQSLMLLTPCPARSAAVQMGKSVVAFSTVVLGGGYYQTFQSSKIQPQRIVTIL